MKRILITGAAGKIGDALRTGLRGSYSLIRLLDIAPLGKAEAGEEILSRRTSAILPRWRKRRQALTASSIWLARRRKPSGKRCCR